MTETSILKSLDQTQIHTHTNTHGQIFLKIDQMFKHAATYTTHMKIQQTNFHPFSRIRTCNSKNQVTATLHYMTTGIGRYKFMECKNFLNLKFWMRTKGSKYQCGFCNWVQGYQKNYKHVNKNDPTNTVHGCQTERKFIRKANCVQLVQVLEIDKREEWQELDLLKYAYSS